MSHNYNARFSKKNAQIVKIKHRYNLRNVKAIDYSAFFDDNIQPIIIKRQYKKAKPNTKTGIHIKRTLLTNRLIMVTVSLITIVAMSIIIYVDPNTANNFSSFISYNIQL